MATNQLLPFANGSGANVETYANWSALAQVGTGFGSGLAVSKHFNYILAQGGAAGYAIGKVVVDWLGQDATIDATTLGTNFEAALNARFGTYLPLTGGTLTGNLFMSSCDILNASNSGSLNFYGGNTTTNGSRLALLGGQTSPLQGRFYLEARAGGSSAGLDGRPDGTLMWASESVETFPTSSGGTAGYIRYKSGLQICYGRTSGSGVSVTFPLPFSAIPVVIANSSATTAKGLIATDATTTGFMLYNSENHYASQWLAVGWWK